jgi:hypothetical protein
LTDSPPAPAPATAEPLKKEPTFSLGTPAATGEAAEGGLDALADRVDALENKIEKAPAAAGAPASSSEIAELKETIRRLENRVSELSQKQSVTQGNLTTAVDDETDSEPAPAPEQKPAIKPVQAAYHAPAHKAQSLVPRWVLRSAQPGRALVAREGRNEMQSVAIGDTLPGIGYVTGIFNQDSRWIVQGTEGRIAQ